MKIRTKITLIILLLWAIVFFAIWIGSQRILKYGYLQLEITQAKNNSMRVLEALNQQIDAVATIASDWSTWNDMYHFIVDQNQTFIKTNLVPSSFTAAQVDVMLFFNAQGKLVKQASFDAKTGEKKAVPKALIDYLTPTNPVVHLTTVDGAVKGMVALPNGIILIASHAIVTSNKTGPVRGTFVTGRYVTREMINLMQQITKIDMTLLPLPAVRENAEQFKVYQALLKTDLVIDRVSDKRLNTYQLLYDTSHQPIAIIQISLPRPIYVVGLHTIYYYSTVFFVYSGLILLLLWYILQRFIVRRIESLSKQFEGAPSASSMLTQILNHSSDEISRATSLYYQAMHDPLTGLANRNLLYKIFQRAVLSVDKSKHKIALLFFDIDFFKRVNDTLGHAIGDELLICMAKRLQADLQPQDVAARLGGDEFVVLLVDCSMDIILKRVNGLFDALKAPVMVEGHHLTLLSSVGVSLYPDHGVILDELINKADIALYYAKETGRQRCEFYSDKLNRALRVMHKNEFALQRALDRQELLVYYQPIYDAKTDAIVSFEALLRWQHPSKGIISASEIMPIAEKTGLIITIGEWVMRVVCEQLCRWQKEGMSIVPIAINISSVQTQKTSILKMVTSILEQAGVLPQYITLELTETGFIEMTDNVSNELRELEQVGVKIAIDDFGIGYSGLRYLKSLPIDTIKIDQSFIKDIVDNQYGRIITVGMVDVAHRLGLKVIAEGVETKEQFAFLRENSVDFVQGYYFSKPLDSTHASHLLQKNQEVIAKRDAILEK